jgi:membrane-bound lytic murein transglycosylase D
MPRWALALLLSTVPAWAGPLPESAAGRRAVRGAAVEVVRESDELRQLRDFDEQSFPRPLPGFSSPATRDDGSAASAVRRVSSSGTGNMGGPDVIPPEPSSPDQELVKPIETPPAIPWLDQVKLPDLPVRLDPRVVRYLEFYKSDKRGRAIMTSWLKKQGRWKPLFEDALRRAGLPLALTYVSMIESGFDPLDHSHAGAVGLWQFMPEGGKIYGLRIDYWIDERRNPEKATEAFVHYIGDLKQRFGAWPLTLAAFNAGYGALLRSMQKYNSNDYWELCKHEDGLPWETTLYVPKAMAVAVVGENKKLFGYDDVVTDPPYAFDRVSVPSSMSLAAMAKAAGVSVAELSALNPELRRNRTPPEPWQARVPRGAGARFLAAYEQHRELVKPFVVRFGERLDDIAAAHGASTRELRALNGVDDSAEVRPGLTLLVPDGRKPVTPPPCDTVIVAVPDKDELVAGKKRVFYRTLPQDSPSEIAAFFKVRPTELARWNNVDLEARLASNMVLQLWVANDFDTAKAALVDGARVRVVTVGSPEFFDLVEARRGRRRLSYVVKKGDDLKRIGKKFNLTVADLERINRFGAAHTDLAVGQKLTVYVSMSAAEKAKAACALTPGGLEPDSKDNKESMAPPGGKESIDAAKEPTTPRDPIVDDEQRKEEGVAVPESQSRGLPRPPPSDGRP